jgi:tetratricopeptide (TPR) repeat protein
MHRMKLVTLLLAALAAGCAQVPTQTDNGKPALSYSEAQSKYQQGMTSYRENRTEAALNDLAIAVASGQLKVADANNARKHIAFIHCAAGRELQCREQFQAILKSNPDFDLAPSEVNHPQWGTVWRSTKGAVDEKRALSQASSASATPGQQKLAEGIKEYEAGRYKESLDALQAAVKGGLPAKADELRARKYTAFVYCLTKRTKPCRAEFKQIFVKDPAFELLPSESGHPAWASVYRSEKAAAAKKAGTGEKTEKKK